MSGTGDEPVESKRVRRLTSGEIEAYDVLEPSLAATVRVVDIPLIPGGFAGITLGRWVCLADQQPTNGESSLLAHELVHVRQWREQGVLRFGVAYLGAFGRGLVRERNWNAAYRAIPAEVEARAEATEWVRRKRASRPSGDAPPSSRLPRD